MASCLPSVVERVAIKNRLSDWESACKTDRVDNFLTKHPHTWQAVDAPLVRACENGRAGS
jgi:hypothetical protein